MPITPFHFGPGALLKALAPRAVSLTAFVASQVAIDLESGYHLIRNEWPVHRTMHSLPVAALVGLLTGTFIWLAGRRLQPSTIRAIHAEVEPLPAHLGGLIGGLSHPLLDAVMHSDLQPFWPVSIANPLLGAVSLAELHVACVASGVAGVAVLWVRHL